MPDASKSNTNRIGLNLRIGSQNFLEILIDSLANLGHTSVVTRRGSPTMGRRMKEHEDVVEALSMLEQVTALLDAAGLSEIAVYTDYAKQLLDQNILLTTRLANVPNALPEMPPETPTARDL
jgi:hypothetical protein